MSSIKVLVVDDEPDVVSLLREWLKEETYDVFSAFSGGQAFRTFFQNQPDLTITDLRMPGMDGFELIRRIREVSEGPVLALTVLDSEDHMVRGLNLGADEYLVKPVTKRAFLARIRSLLRRASLTMEARPLPHHGMASDATLGGNFLTHEIRTNGGAEPMGRVEQRLLRVLVVDDEPDVVSFLREWLEEEAYEVFGAFNGGQAFRTFFHSQPDLTITDLRMPGMDGFELIRRIREVSDEPVLVLTVLDGEDQMVRGLNLGADEYLIKPVTKRALLARVRSLLRHLASNTEAPPPAHNSAAPPGTPPLAHDTAAPSGMPSFAHNTAELPEAPLSLHYTEPSSETPLPPSYSAPPSDASPIYSDAALELNFPTQEVWAKGAPVPLGPIEHRLLAFLVQNRDRVIGFQELLDRVWSEGRGSRDSLKSHILSLRQKVEDDPQRPRLIIPVLRSGYRYRPPDPDSIAGEDGSAPKGPG